MTSISLENLIGRTRNLVDALDWPDPQPADVVEPLAGFLMALGDLVEPMSNIRVTAEGERALKAALADAADALGDLADQIGNEAVRSGLAAAGVLISTATLDPRERRAVAPTLLQPRVAETKIIGAILADRAEARRDAPRRAAALEEGRRSGRIIVLEDVRKTWGLRRWA